MNKKVVFIQPAFPHYRKPFFDNVKNYYNILLLSTNNEKGHKSANTKYSKIIKGITFFKNIQLPLWLKETFSFKPDVIINYFSVGNLSIPFTILYCKLFNAKHILWGHGYNRSKNRNLKKSFSGRLRILYMKLSDGVLLYTKKKREEIANYVNVNKLFVAQNTIDTNEYKEILTRLRLHELEELKKEINFAKFNFVFIGRIYKEKLPLDAIKIVEALNYRTKLNVNMHFIGNGNEVALLKQYCAEKNINSFINFHGSVFDPAINGKFLFCADLMLMPGPLGLSVNHAFAFGCPVATYLQKEKGPYHGPEADYVKDWESGLFLNDDDIFSSIEKLKTYLLNEKIKSEMRFKIYTKIYDDLTINNMVNGLDLCIKYTLK